MRIARRSLLLTHTLLASPALAQAPWPRRPITFIAPAAPEGATDILARLMAQTMQASLGQPVVVENRGGAAGVIATKAIAAAQPDGHTIALA